MDDERGHVIDGTERASQWRRSRPAPPAGEQADEPRSDAPKSIASSLLVPADLVQTTVPASNATSPGRGIVEQGETPSEHAGAPSDLASAKPEHRNPFLAQESADAPAAHGTSGPSRRDRVWAIAIAVAGGARRRLRIRHGLQAETSRRRTRALARVRPAAVVLGVLTCAIGLGVMTRMSASSAPVRSSRSGVIGASLERVSPALLAAVANSVGEISRSAREAQTRRVRLRQATVKHPRARTPATSVVAARFTAPPSSRSAVGWVGGSFVASRSPTAGSTPSTAQVSTANTSTAGGVGGSGPSGSTATGSPPSTTRPSTTSTTSPTSAFGAAGALGPGSSPNG